MYAGGILDGPASDDTHRLKDVVFLLTFKHRGAPFEYPFYRCDFADVSWTSASFTARGCLIFNDSHSTDAAVCAIDFGGDKTATSGTFTIQFPAAAASTAIIRIA